MTPCDPLGQARPDADSACEGWSAVLLGRSHSPSGDTSSEGLRLQDLDPPLPSAQRSSDGPDIFIFGLCWVWALSWVCCPCLGHRDVSKTRPSAL